jgi:hypothetical protein
VSTVVLIIRWSLAIALGYMIYKEAGPFTVLFYCLIFIDSEMKLALDKWRKK